MDHIESGFSCTVDGRVVPGALWEPATPAGPVPLVLLGHGGNGHKRQDYVKAVARGLARHHGVAAAAVDGPVHGDRRADSDPRALARDFDTLWNSDGAQPRPTSPTISRIADPNHSLTSSPHDVLAGALR